MPPVTHTGIRQNPAARAKSGKGRAPHRHHSAPITTPMSGNAQRAYRMFFSFQANCGIGSAENMANATAIVCKAVIGLAPFIITWDAAYNPHHGVGRVAVALLICASASR